MASTQRLRQAWHQAAQAWPKDPLRPTVQFADAIRTAADRALADTVTLSPTQEHKAELACQSLLRITNNEAARRYPMRFSTTTPASFPKHYTRIEDAVARVNRGEKVERPGFLQRWFRFSA